MRRLFIALLVVLVAVALPLADASAKLGKSSFGSRGARTADRPVERSLTPPPPAAPAMKPTPQLAPSAPAFAPQPMGFFQRNPMLSGFMGGMLGVGIGSMLFGHPAYASFDAAPGAGIFGLLVQLAIVGGLIWFGLRLFRGGTRAAPGMGSARPPVIDVPYEEVARPMIAQRARQQKEFEPTDQDKGEFARILIEAQRAWSNADLAALRRLGTPEVVSWLSEDLTDYSSKGLRNKVEDVALKRGEVIEAWREGDREYATAVLTYTARDHTVSVETGALVDGDPTRPVDNSEAWTFVRTQGGKWLLSAVERE